MKRQTEIGRRLREIRGTTSIEDMATRIGVNKNTLGAYERGERLPEIDFLVEFASITGTDFCELLVLRLASSRAARSRGLVTVHPAGTAESRLNEGSVFVPYASPDPERRDEAGTGVPPDYGTFGFHRSWLEEQGLNPDQLVLVTVSSDSMADTLRRGDVLLVDRAQRSVLDEGVYVLASPHGRLVKRLQLLPSGRIRMSSDNPAYADLEVPRDAFSEPGGSAYRIFGQVVWAGTRL